MKRTITTLVLIFTLMATPLSAGEDESRQAYREYNIEKESIAAAVLVYIPEGV